MVGARRWSTSTPPGGSRACRPDGRQLLLRRAAQPYCSLWLFDLGRRSLSRLGLEGDNHNPLWMADGESFLISQDTVEALRRQVLRARVDGGGEPETLVSADFSALAESVSSDGRFVVLTHDDRRDRNDIFVLDRSTGEIRPFLVTDYDEDHPALSPDGTLLAYAANDSGRSEVYVRPFPGPGGKYTISNQGGTGPVWSRDGRELFYAEGDRMMRVAVERSPRFTASTPELLFESPDYVWERPRNYDVLADGSGFVIVRRGAGTPATRTLRVVFDWFAELDRLAPTGGSVIGTRLGPYEITARLGEGGMGEVYRATDTRLEREVAIKVLPAAFVQDRERLGRFEREAKLLAQLNHTNIAQIYGVEASGESHALVMELVEGPTLADRLAQGALPLDESLSIAKQIAEALEEAHEKGIVHRDLKPQNVKASIEGKTKVLDFGLAKAMDPAAGASSSVAAGDLARSPTLMQSPTLTGVHGTQLGVILGTAAYMSPEQARGGSVDKRADIWAFGVVLYEMLAGRSPVRSRNRQRHARRRAQDRDRPLAPACRRRRRRSVPCSAAVSSGIRRTGCTTSRTRAWCSTRSAPARARARSRRFRSSRPERRGSAISPGSWRSWGSPWVSPGSGHPAAPRFPKRRTFRRPVSRSCRRRRARSRVTPRSRPTGARSRSVSSPSGASRGSGCTRSTAARAASSPAPSMRANRSSRPTAVRSASSPPASCAGSRSLRVSCNPSRGSRIRGAAPGANRGRSSSRPPPRRRSSASRRGAAACVPSPSSRQASRAIAIRGRSPAARRCSTTPLSGKEPGIHWFSVKTGERRFLLSDPSRAAYDPRGYLLWDRKGTLVAQQLRSRARPALGRRLRRRRAGRRGSPEVRPDLARRGAGERRRARRRAPACPGCAGSIAAAWRSAR